MVGRCHDPRNKSFYRYGAVGIIVCDRWRESFAAFADDMGFPPAPNLSIDRIDNTKGYSPDNCRWATATQQQRNKNNNRLLTFNGRTATVAEWAEMCGIGAFRIYQRLNSGWSDEEAVTVPIRVRRQTKPREKPGPRCSCGDMFRQVRPSGTVVCSACQRRRRAEYRARKFAAGLCIDCSRPREQGFRACALHAEKRRTAARKATA